MCNNKQKCFDIIFLLSIFSLMFFYFKRLIYDTDYLDFYDHAVLAHGLKDSIIAFIKENSSFPRQLSYPLWHFVFAFFYHFFRNDGISCGLSTAIFMLLQTIVLLKGLRNNGISYKKSTIYTFCITFYGPLYCSIINKNYYLGQLTPNVWHNPTTIAVKPFAILSFFLTLDIINKENKFKRYICLAVVMMISCLSKPSFMQMYGVVLLLFCVIKTFLTKGVFFRKACLIGGTCIPSLVVLLLQYYINFNSSTDNQGIRIKPFYVWNAFTNSIIGSIIISILFCIIVICVCNKYENSNALLLILCLSISGIGTYGLLSIEGIDLFADFAWGAYIAVALIVILCCIILEKNIINKYKYIVCCGVLGIHVLCGFIYYINVFINRSYAGPLFGFL